jgi:hypothetical protein
VLKAKIMRLGSKLAILVFAVVAIAHFLRLMNGIEITVGEWDFPRWASMLGVVGPSVIAYMLWREG